MPLIPMIRYFIHVKMNKIRITRVFSAKTKIRIIDTGGNEILATPLVAYAKGGPDPSPKLTKFWSY